MGELGILLFLSPFQHRAPETAARLARAAVREGHRATVFFLGDGVYNTSRALAEASPESVVRRFADLPTEVRLINCTTCARARGLTDEALVPHAQNGTLEDLSDLLLSADRFLTFAQEG
jgi:sulfur relay (sulfurtransferase) complex TusBCD TusD component (DsrE family)